MEPKYVIKHHLLEELINLVAERIPKWIACDNWSAVSVVISNAQELLIKEKEKLSNENNENFQTLFLQSLEHIAQEIEKNKLPELIPLVFDLRSIQRNYLGLAVEYYERKLREKDTIQKKEAESSNLNRFKLFKKLINSAFRGANINLVENNLLDSNLSTETWKYAAKEKLKNLREDFNFKSVSVPNDKSWSEIYVWASDSYKAIEEAQAAIGLDKKSASLNGKINLVFNPAHLKEIGANGSVYSEEIDIYYSTVFLNSFDKESQKAIWQHEYAHAVDNRSGIEYLKSIGETNIDLSNAFLTRIELTNQLIKKDKTVSKDFNIAKAQVWVSEAISCIISGSNIEDFVENNYLKRKLFEKKISELFLSKLLTQDVLNSLDKSKKEKLINNIKIIYFASCWVEKMYIFGEKDLVLSLLNPKTEHEKSFSNYFKESCSEIKSLIKDENSFENYIKVLKDKENLICKDLKELMLSENYAHTDYIPYFGTSKTSLSSVIKSATDGKAYWTRPLEIFARSCEDLQKPLVASSLDYFSEKNSQISSHLEFINPQLNLTERKIFIETLYSMLNILGIKPDLDITATALNKNLIKNDGYVIDTMDDFIGNETNSTNCINDSASKIVYKMAKMRESKLNKNIPFKIK